MLQFKTSDDVRLAYYVDDFADPWKAVPTILLLHAAMGHAKRFYAWVPRLSRHYRVVRLDLRGHGASQVPAPESALSMERLVADVVELMDHLGLDRAHVVGNSAGGYIAQNLAMSRHERLQSLMLFGPTPGLKNSQAASWLPRIAADGLRQFLTETIADRFPMDRTDPRQLEWFINEAAKNDVAYLSRFVGLMTTLDWSDKLHSIKCPTLVVCPGAQTMTDINNYSVMGKLIPDAELITYEGMPHNIGDSAPDRCVDDVLAFLNRRFGPP